MPQHIAASQKPEAHTGHPVNANNDDSGPFLLSREIVQPRDFVLRWAPLYVYPLETLYDRNIRQPLSPVGVRELFEWKNGGRLARLKAESVQRNYIDHISDVNRLDRTTSASEFLEIFKQGGAIWRIFWLHLWAPDRFPIYDQHVHRAMTWIETGHGSEIPTNDEHKVKSYLDRYISFYSRFTGIDEREVDKALWACGKAMKALIGAPVL